MDHPREQFDELLGGPERLPATVSLLKFANARSQEILALTEAVEEPQNTHLAFQKMPRHLRRRAMSHNVKRMPRRLREVHLSQMEKSGLPTKARRPSRKFRRKASNLLQEYNRRQRTHVWLETHIWHAKRFHMCAQWGYKLPQSPSAKSFRACYRATAKHCLIQDMSYLNCIELQGREEDILKGLSQLTSPDCGLTFAARASISGNREGSVVTFKRGAYPFHTIGKVTFMWRPESAGERRTLWIWCHPAFYREFLQEVIATFNFKVEEMEQEQTKDVDKNSKRKQKDVERLKLKNKNLDKLPKYSNENVEMTLLKDTLNRFRLTGPLAQVVLTEALKFVEIEEFVKREDTSMEVDGEEKSRSQWLDCYKGEDAMKCLKQQLAFWKVLQSVNSADELSPRMIISAVVMDPRLTMPNTRIKAINDQECSVQPQIPEGASGHSAMWDAALRNAVTRSKMAAAELNQLRSRALVPGLATTEWLGKDNVSHVPLLLVQRPGCQGFGSGWDVIVPAGWGMPVWLGLVYRGARAGGLRETQHLTLEMSQGPELHPDTAAGREQAEQKRIAGMEKHFRLPPDKRVNYVKLGVAAPFHCPWKQLLQDWSPGGERADFYVIRNRFQLNYLESIATKKKPEPEVSFSERDKQSGLVQVELEMCGRGTVGPFSMICNLGKKDLRLAKDKSGRGPLEPLHEDVNEQQRKSLRESHLMKLKRLRRKRVKARRELEERGVFPVKEKFLKSPTEDIVKEQAEVMRKLWLPSDDQVKSSCSRNIVGFVVFGDYSFARSKCVGYGFVALTPLLANLKKKQCQVLVRNVTSQQYNFATLKVLNHS